MGEVSERKKGEEMETKREKTTTTMTRNLVLWFQKCFSKFLTIFFYIFKLTNIEKKFKRFLKNNKNKKT